MPTADFHHCRTRSARHLYRAGKTSLCVIAFYLGGCAAQAPAWTEISFTAFGPLPERNIARVAIGVTRRSDGQRVNILRGRVDARDPYFVTVGVPEYSRLEVATYDIGTGASFRREFDASRINFDEHKVIFEIISENESDSENGEALDFGRIVDIQFQVVSKGFERF